MIPRFRPALGLPELAALLQPASVPVGAFEERFAEHFGVAHAVAFPYGRSALWAFFQAQGFDDAEVVLPAYTCSVVAHAIVLSGNRPRFVDIDLRDYNADLGQLADAVNERTRAVIATHLFGYPLDVDAVDEIVADAEARYSHPIVVIQDCAHSFAAEWQGRSVVQAPHVALFGLNISKLMTSLFGGMLATDDPEMARRVRGWRDAHFESPGPAKALRRRLYGAAALFAFTPHAYGLVHALETHTPWLDRATRSYHLDDEIRFPPDYQDLMLPIEAEIGVRQLERYDSIIESRRELARFYREELDGLAGVELPPLVEGATYSHFVMRVSDRAGWLRRLARRGIQLGELIQYSVPELPAYRAFVGDADFPRSRVASRTTINLPMGYSLDARDRARIVAEIRGAAQI